jgi:hypothetical protein
VDAELAAYCDRKFPLPVRDRVWATHGWRGDTVTLFEWRPLFDQPDKAVDMKVAQFRYDAASGKWSLFCADRNGKWHSYVDLPASKRFTDLLEEVDEDPTGIFWG